jgi:hypothetical protein
VKQAREQHSQDYVVASWLALWLLRQSFQQCCCLPAFEKDKLLYFLLPAPFYLENLCRDCWLLVTCPTVYVLAPIFRFWAALFKVLS